MPPFCNSLSMQRHQRRSRSRCHASSTAQMSSTKLLLTFVLLGLFIAAASAVDEKKSTDSKSFKPAPSASTSLLSTLSTNSAAPRDEIYIDDEGIEGSGGRGEIHDDLEKDPDYSGSGFGPDDEDSSTDHHHQSIGKTSGKSQNSNDNDFITSRTSNSGTIIGSSGNAGSSSGGIIDSSNTGINSIGKDYLPPYSSSQPHNRNNHANTQNTTTTTASTTTSSSSSSSALYPPNSSYPSFPGPTPPRRKNDDYDDFDLDETIGGVASGDGGHDNNDDDDHTGDDDIDEEIIKRVHHMHDLDKSKTFDEGIHGNRDQVDDNYDDNNRSLIDLPTHNEDEDDDDEDYDDDIVQPRINLHRINSLNGGSRESDQQTPKVAVVDATDATGSSEKDKDTKLDGGIINVDEEGDDGDDEEAEEDAEGTDDVYTDVTDTTDDGGHKRPGNNQGTIHELDATNNVNSLPTDNKDTKDHTAGNEVLIMSDDDRTTSFFAQPGILAAVIGGAVVGLLCAILVVMFIVYRMRKKDEGSYALDEPKRSPAVNSYAKNANNREFYA